MINTNILKPVEPCYSAFHKTLTNSSEVRLKFPKFTTNLAISLCSCQSNCELQNEAVNFMPNFVGKLQSSLLVKFTSFRGCWFGNNYIMNLKNNEEKPQPSKAYLWCLLLKCKLFERHRGTWMTWLDWFTVRTDRTRVFFSGAVTIPQYSVWKPLRTFLC